MSDDPDVVAAKMMRPNDLCTAAYFGDVEKLKELLAVEAVEEEPPIDPEFDPLAPIDEDAVAGVAERKARRDANTAEVAKRLAATRRIVTRLSPVNVQEYGFFISATESICGDAFALVPRFKTSRRSMYGAAPLHWAVLGREHAAIAFLIMQGARVDQLVPGLNVSVEDILRINESLETKKVVAKAVAAYQEKMAKEQAAADARELILKDRDAQRRRAQEEIQRKEEEERLEAERAAQQEADAAGESAAPEE